MDFDYPKQTASEKSVIEGSNDDGSLNSESSFPLQDFSSRFNSEKDDMRRSSGPKSLANLLAFKENDILASNSSSIVGNISDISSDGEKELELEEEQELDSFSLYFFDDSHFELMSAFFESKQNKNESNISAFRITELECENTTLRSELSAMDNVIKNDLRPKISNQEKKIVKLNKEISEMKETISGLEKSNFRLTESTTQLENLKTSIESEKNALELKADKCRNELESMKTENSRLKLEVSRQKSENESMIRNLQEQLNFAQMSLDKSKLDVQSITQGRDSNISDLENNLRLANIELQEKSRYLGRLTEDISNLDMKLQSKDEENMALRRKAAGLEEEIIQKRNHCDYLEGQVRLLKSEVSRIQQQLQMQSQHAYSAPSYSSYSHPDYSSIPYYSSGSHHYGAIDSSEQDNNSIPSFHPPPPSVSSNYLASKPNGLAANGVSTSKHVRNSYSERNIDLMDSEENNYSPTQGKSRSSLNSLASKPLSSLASVVQNIQTVTSSSSSSSSAIQDSRHGNSGMGNSDISRSSLSSLGNLLGSDSGRGLQQASSSRSSSSSLSVNSSSKSGANTPFATENSLVDYSKSFELLDKKLTKLISEKKSLEEESSR